MKNFDQYVIGDIALWVTGCALCAYAIKLTKSPLPILGLMFVPSYKPVKKS